MTDRQKEDRADYYRAKATEARSVAETMSDYQARQTMLQVASLWEAMAAREEKKHSPSR